MLAYSTVLYTYRNIFKSTMVLRKLAIMTPKASEADDFLGCTYVRGRRVLPLPPYDEYRKEAAAAERAAARRTRKTLSTPEPRRIRDVVTSDDDAVSDLTVPESSPHFESAASIEDPPPHVLVGKVIAVHNGPIGLFIDATEHTTDHDDAASTTGFGDAVDVFPPYSAPRVTAPAEKPRGMRRVMSAAALAHALRRKASDHTLNSTDHDDTPTRTKCGNAGDVSIARPTPCATAVGEKPRGMRRVLSLSLLRKK